MDFDGGAAAGAGLIGEAVMSVLLYAEVAMMPRQTNMNLFLMLGTVMFRNNPPAYMAGAMVHAVMSIVFGLAHVAVYAALAWKAS
jgi:hypothetical protein